MVFGIVQDKKTAELAQKSEKIYEFYNKFSKFIGQGNSVGELTDDETVMETLIKEKYQNITSM